VACASLSLIFEDSDLRPKIDPLTEQILNEFTAIAASSNDEHFFELVYVFIKFFSASIVNHPLAMQNLLGALASKIVNPQSLQKLVLQRVWNVLLKLSSDQYFIPRYQNYFEEYLINIIKLLSQKEEQLNENFLELFSSLIEASKLISDKAQILFESVEFIFKRQNNKLGALSRFLNNFLIYGDSFFNQNPKNIEKILLLSVESTNNSDNSPSDLSQSALLLQLTIQKFSHLLSNEHLDFIFRNVQEKLSKDLKQDYLVNRLLGVFLSGFISHYQMTFQIL